MQSIRIAKGESELELLGQMGNRHGLITGATGTGKTVTLRVLAEGFSEMGVPVFFADVKGDLAGITQPGVLNEKITERLNLLGAEFTPADFPAVFWDVFGEKGHPLRATVSDMGPLLLSRLLNLNDTQSSVLSIVFKIANQNGLLLLDLKDIKAVLQYVSENPQEFSAEYGNLSKASLGTIQRNLIALEEQGGEFFFGEPALNIEDLLQTDGGGKGVINILSAEKLMEQPRVYATMLLWLLSELFEKLPEVGDTEKPKLVFFFDEAHLLFSDLPKVVLEKIEQVARLIRSKGVGIYFVSQNPSDIPDSVLGQLGNRVQHALRAFTPRDQKALRAAVESFRNDRGLELQKIIGELGVGEALISFLDGKGMPRSVERALIYPPKSNLSPLSDEKRRGIIRGSVLFGVYDNLKDRESAYEVLKAKLEQARKEEKPAAEKGSRRQGMLEAFFKSAVRSIGTRAGSAIIRGILGTLGKKG